MRILNVTQSYAPFLEFGGPPVKVCALSQGLARRGHQVTVLTPDWGLAKRLKEIGEQSGVENTPCGMRRMESGVEAVYLPTRLHYRALSWNPGVKSYCRAQLQNFDVVHIFGLYDLLGPAVAGGCRLRGIPYVVEPIGMFVPMVRNIQLKRMYHALFGKALLQGAGGVIATSEQEFSELASGGMEREKIVLRRNGVEVPAHLPERGAFRAAHRIAPDAKIILFLGRLSQKKSPDLLLRAFAGLSAQCGAREVHLIFAGPDESGMKARLEQLAQQEAAQFGASSRVHFVGPLFGEAKWQAYRDVDIFVLPSQNENFGNTAAEAVAVGTPVIVTEQCGIAPLLADVAGLVVEHDEAALTAALQHLLTDRSLYARLAEGCRTVTSRLGWEDPIREMEVLYEGLAGKRSVGAQSQFVG